MFKRFSLTDLVNTFEYHVLIMIQRRSSSPLVYDPCHKALTYHLLVTVSLLLLIQRSVCKYAINIQQLIQWYDITYDTTEVSPL
jgi:hypothetical protein